MSTYEARLPTTGTQQNQIHSRHGHYHSRTGYESTYWDRLSEPSIFLPFLVLLVSVLYSTNILEISLPPASRLHLTSIHARIWNAVVSLIPPSVLFAIDDWLSPFPLPRKPFDRLSPTEAHEAKSATLARILGLGPGGLGRLGSFGGIGGLGGSGGGGVGAASLLASVSQAGKSGLARLMPKGDVDRPPGLGNISYSCYQNSVLQALASLAPMRTFLDRIAGEEDAGALPPVMTAQTLDKLVRDLYGPTENGQTLWTPSALKRMSTIQQQDAQEYFCNLLTEVEEEIQKALKAIEQMPGLDRDLTLSLDLPSAKAEPVDSEHASSSGSGSNGSSGGDNSVESASSLSRSSSSSIRSNDSGYHSTASSRTSHTAAIASSFRIPLEGLAAQRIVCQECGYSSGLSMNPFYSLTLNPGIGGAECRLEDALDSFSAVENIEGVQCASCTLLKFRGMIKTIIGRLESAPDADPETMRLKQPVPYERLEAIETALDNEDFEERTIAGTCKIPPKQRVYSTKSRQVGIARAPPSIAFHINRSRFDENTGRIFKNPVPIRFPLHLDLGPWCLGSAASSAPSSGTAKDVLSEKDSQNSAVFTDRDLEQWQLPAQLPMVAGSIHNSRLVGPIYELRAVVTHFGHHESGHYICYRKHPTAKQAAPLSDMSIKIEAAEERPASVAPEAEDTPMASPPSTATVDDDDDKTLRAVSEDPQEDDRTVVGSTIEDDEGTAVSKPANVEEEEEEEQDQWWRLSDQNVSRSDEATVLAQGGVFMLFYDRIDPRSVFRPTSKCDGLDDSINTPVPESKLVNDTGDADTTSKADVSMGVQEAGAQGIAKGPSATAPEAPQPAEAEASGRGKVSDEPAGELAVLQEQSGPILAPEA